MTHMDLRSKLTFVIISRLIVEFRVEEIHLLSSNRFRKRRYLGLWSKNNKFTFEIYILGLNGNSLSD